MFSQQEIDAVLVDAQQAVDTLADDVQAVATVRQGPAQVATKRSVPNSPGRLERTLKLSVPLLVRLAHQSMSIGEIMRIGPGTILEFNRTVACELDLMINNCQIGRGIAVKVGERFGLRITSIGNVKERIDSLGPR
jgi:flagellar motor switch protein FliN/FliY